MKPIFSFVAAARNDDYGGNWINRLDTYVKMLAYQAKRTKTPCELVFVEYNPIPGKKLLADELSIPKNPYFESRFIIVPPEFHQTLPGHEKTHICEFIAKNIGAKRARGEWIVINNPDVVHGNDLFDFLAKGELDKNTYYRIARRDTCLEYFDPKLAPEEILSLMASPKNLVRVLYNQITLYYSYKEWLFNVFIHGRTWGAFKRSPFFNRWKEVKTDDDTIAENAAGDFFMAHKEAWNKVNGYEEAVVLTGVMDGYMLYTLYCAGYKQRVLPYGLYHIYHHRKGVVYMASWHDYRTEKKKMLETKIPYKINPPNWGNPAQNFKEILR